MDFDRLLATAELARGGKRLSADDVSFVRKTIPSELPMFPRMKRPPRLSHPAGFSVSGAPVGTFVRSALLLAGRKALGKNFTNSEYYERVESDVALCVMRSHFHGGHPKGTFCCSQCTLALLPVLEANIIRWFDGRSLARDVRQMIHAREWRFASPPNAKMLRWSLGA
jgi:hypothetical protein